MISIKDKNLEISDYKNESDRLMQQLCVCCFSIYHHPEDCETYKKLFNNYFGKLLIQSKKDNCRWQFYSSQILVDTYEKGLARYLENNSEFDELDYIDKLKEGILLGVKEEKSLSQPEGGEIIYQEKAFYFEYNLMTWENNIYGYRPKYILLDFLDANLINNIEQSLKKKMDFLELKLRECSNTEINKNPHPTIFVDAKSFNLFENLIENIGVEHADITFIYRVMLLDGFIHQESEGVFNKWCKDKMNITLNSRLQQIYHTAIKGRKSVYLLTLNQFQLKSKTYS